MARKRTDRLRQAYLTSVLDAFSSPAYDLATADEPHLRPATPEEIAESLSFALRYDGRRRVHTADTAMAQITAERLVRHLELSGFVVMKTPPGRMPTSSDYTAR